MRNTVSTRTFLVVLMCFVAGATLHSHIIAENTPGTFTEVSEAIGISCTPTGERDDWGHGTAFCDYDGDGDLDLYVAMDTGQPNRLYQNQLNNGGAGFVDVAGVVGVADVANSRAVVWADYDNDGDPDLFVSNFESANRLYQNNGGIFTDVASAAGVDSVREAHSACWGDYDNDGHLDLFVGNYGTLTDPDPNLLFHNNGDGTFDEVGGPAGVADTTRPALACAWIDYNNDNKLDLYIAYDKLAGNIMYKNNGDGTFSDESFNSNTDIAFNAMGIAVGDYDHNGYLDMYITNTPEGNELLHNNGDGTFSQVAAAKGLLVHRIGWGTAFLDYDNDGDDDLFVVNWSFNPGVASDNVLFRNNGNATFTDISSTAGVLDSLPTYGCTVGDYNNNGFPDIYVNNQNYPSRFYECVPGSNKWLKLKTVGVQSNRDGIGAKIKVVTGGTTQLKDVRSGSSYLGALSPEVEFGVGSLTTVDQIIVEWPSGIVDTFNDVPTNQYLVVTEGGTIHPVPVFITGFDAIPLAAAVELRWNIQSDEEIKGFRIYRREVSGANERVLNDGQLLAPAIRRFVDDTALPNVDYEYGLGVIELDGGEVRSGFVRASARTYSFELLQNHPNPFNPSTTIGFVMESRSHVAIDVYDPQGKHIVQLVDDWRDVGVHEIPWDGRDAVGRQVSTGVYFYRLASGTQVRTRKMILLK